MDNLKKYIKESFTGSFFRQMQILIVLLGLMLSFDFISQYMQLPSTFYFFNISLIFVFVIYKKYGFLWSILALSLRFLLNPVMLNQTYDLSGIFYAFRSLFFDIIFISLFHLITLKSAKINKYYAFGISFIVVMILSVILNPFVFVPVQWLASDTAERYSLTDFERIFELNNLDYLGIKNYYASIITVSILSSVLKFTILALGVQLMNFEHQKRASI